MLPLVITLCLLALGTAVPVSTDPKPCCVPDVFEGKIAISAAQDVDHHLSGAFAMASVHLDMKNKRVAQQQTTFDKGQKVQVNIIQTESDNATYIFYPDHKYCVKLPSSKIHNCLTSDMKFAINLQLGINPSLDVDVYTMTAVNKTFTYINVSVTKANCVPVGQTVVRGWNGGWVSQTESFYDLALGIKDTSVFNVPDYCQKAGLGPLTGAAQEAMTAYLERRAAFL